MKRQANQPIRVLVVEDSRVQRELLVGMLRSVDQFSVIGTASDGKEAIATTLRLRPDVIAMDIDLQILDGYEATRQIMQRCPTPIVLISSDRDAARRSIEGLAAGALAVVSKPEGRASAASSLSGDPDRSNFLTTLRLMAGVRVVTRYPIRIPAVARRAADASIIQRSSSGRPQILAIAASTGGPAAVQTVLRGLGAGFPLPILLVQHIARGFVVALVEWLNATVPLSVQIARRGEQLLPGHVYLAPEDSHLVTRAPGSLGLCPIAAEDRFCPSADLLFESVAKVYRANAIGLVLTGMGDDGTGGLLALRAAGAPTLAQDAASCVVYGMPRAAVEAGAITRTESLATLAGTILSMVGNVAHDFGAI